ncbi:hypothetical protein [Marinospirillum perlucidum]|uniref:hypothetical protein n=1 Tax=Marinospirillum perlucidum TaxID=1982602 RepID=UPI000DF47FDE|nr:hypothetical protein [Marinospirillum perlucidum]
MQGRKIKDSEHPAHASLIWHAQQLETCLQAKRLPQAAETQLLKYKLEKITTTATQLGHRELATASHRLYTRLASQNCSHQELHSSQQQLMQLIKRHTHSKGPGDFWPAATEVIEPSKDTLS